MNLVQFQRVKELTLELLSCNTGLLDSIRDYCERYHVPIPNDPKIEYLVRQMLSLISEINGKPDENLQGKNTDGELPVPSKISLDINTST